MEQRSHLQRELERRRLAKGLSQRDLSLKAGLNETAVKAIESGKSRNPRMDTLQKLADVLECEVTDLMRPEPAEEAPRVTHGEIDMSRRVPIELGARDLPVYGSIKGGFEGEVVDVQHPVDWTFRPPALVGVDGAFALYVIGDSMEPRYEHGEMVLVHPGRPVRRGNYVAVEFRNQSATVKRFLRLNDHFLELEQLNPPKTLRFPRSDIARVLRIIGTIEER